jgi:hypothetical protein
MQCGRVGRRPLSVRELLEKSGDSLICIFCPKLLSHIELFYNFVH